MKYVVRKAFLDYEKEEKWLNKMAAKGMNMDNYSWRKYTFAQGEPGEYIYRIELLNNLATNAESVAYLKFMEENGVEHVSSYMRWVYLRKKASEGPFEIYTDIESKIKYYKMVNSFWITLALAEIGIGVSNISIGASNLSSVTGAGLINVNFFGGLLCTLLGILFIFASRPLRKKIRKLKKDATVHQ